MAQAASDLIQQYENELAEVEELIQASPGDSSLLSIKADLEELLTITRQQSTTTTTTVTNAVPTERTPNILERALEAAVETSIGAVVATTSALLPAAAAVPNGDAGDREAETNASEVADETATNTVAAEPPKKKAKVAVKDFEIPPHLIILDTDSEAQIQRKKRETKKLKNKWRERKKEFETERKQSSWQSFQKKKGKKLKDKSIFSISDGAKVGVVKGGDR